MTRGREKSADRSASEPASTSDERPDVSRALPGVPRRAARLEAQVAMLLGETYLVETSR
jgi:hypothetical protein